MNFGGVNEYCPNEGVHYLVLTYRLDDYYTHILTMHCTWKQNTITKTATLRSEVKG